MTTSQKFTDTDGDTLRVSLATPAEQFPNGSVIVRADDHIDGESAAVRMTADQLRGMIDALDPPIDYADGGVTCAAIENEVVSPERARSLVQERDLAKDRAATLTTQLHDALDEQATLIQERDRLATILATTARQRDEADKRAATASPRALTAREYLEAAWENAHETDGRGVQAGDWFLERFIDGTIVTARATWSGMPSGDVRMVHAPTPARPEGAEELDALVDASIRGCSDITAPETVRAIADGLAEQGVRVTGEPND